MVSGFSSTKPEDNPILGVKLLLPFMVFVLFSIEVDYPRTRGVACNENDEVIAD